MRFFFTASLFLLGMSTFCQNVILKGSVSENGKPIGNVNIVLKSSAHTSGTSTNNDGLYSLIVPVGDYQITLTSIGLQTISEKITIRQNETKNFQMKEDLLGLDEVVITGTHNAISQFITPVVVSKVSSKILETTQSLSLAEGLNFTPGLRMETNCQNCGFSQVRINGLDGAYSQILINGRNVFSALTGVYGLEMIPTNMIERIEVVRGGGSVLYGGNAIAGTINVITKDPIKSSFSFGNNLAFLKGGIPDNTASGNASVISDNLDKGMTLFAYQRNRKSFDANNDDFSEITKLNNTTFGLDFFWNTTERSRLKGNFNTIKEFRRGGDLFELLPHEANITEQLEHKIYGGDLSYEFSTADYAHKFSVYTSGQITQRESFYGAGLGRKIENDSDFLTLSADEQNTFFSALNSYGKSNGSVWVFGGQYNYLINDQWNLSFGSEYKNDRVDDKANGRTIDQQVFTLGNYAQMEYKPSTDFTFLLGGRFDAVYIDGKYIFRGNIQNTDKKIPIFVPRVTAMYQISPKIKLRASFTQGYRAPQTFDETLHTDVIGGDVIFIEMNKDLEAERSNSFTASVNYTKKEGDTQMNLILEGFATRIKNAFYHADLQQDPTTGIFYKEMVNADGFRNVFGFNAEANFAFNKNISWQTGVTFQKSAYSEAQSLFDGAIESKNVMRTPDFYGYTTLNYEISNFQMSYSGVFTGKMNVPHENLKKIKQTPVFYEQNVRFAYNIPFKNNYKIELSTGVQNIFNAYQSDFDKGAERDSNYIYGPQRPRTFFVGVQCKWN